MRDFTIASGMVPDSAKILREDLILLKLIETRVVRAQGAAEVMEIRLTPLGRQVAKHLLAADETLRSGSDQKRERGRSKA